MERGLVIGALGVLLVSPAHAGNEDEILLGREAAMTGGAVTASASTGSALYYNPAGIVSIDETTLDSRAPLLSKSRRGAIR